MAGILGNGGMGQPGILGNMSGQSPFGPQIPWAQNPLVTMIGAGLLSGRTPSQGFENVAKLLPYGMEAKQNMQQQMLANQEKADAKAQQAQQTAAVNAWLKSQSGVTLSPEETAALTANPDMGRMLFGESLKQKFAGPPKGTDDIQEYQFAVSQGYAGTFSDWQRENKGGTVVNVGPTGVQYPPPKDGFDYLRNADGTVMLSEDPASGAMLPRQVPIPGGPADTSKKDAARQEQQTRYGDVVVEDIRRAKKKVQEQSWYAPVSGAGGAVLSNLGGSAARDTAALIDTVKSSIAFDRLQAMRESSPTGGALGAVTENELRLLQSSIGSLDQSQSADQLYQNLDRVEKIYSDIMQKFAAYPNASQMGFGGGSQPAAAGGGGVFEWSPDGGLRPVQ